MTSQTTMPGADSRVIEVGGLCVHVAPRNGAGGPQAAEEVDALVRKLQDLQVTAQIPRGMPSIQRLVRILVSVDFDAVSAWMGTGQHPRNCLSDFSSGVFAGRVGVGRLLGVFSRLGISHNTTWFIPGHSMETFPAETRSIVESGAEIALHGYCHEDCTQLDLPQQEAILDRCIHLAESLTGKRPVGFRAPLYRISRDTMILLERKGFLYDSSLSEHDSELHMLDCGFSISPVDYSSPPSTWMKPSSPPHKTDVVEIPANWYMEDMTPLQFLPNSTNSHGFVSTLVMQRMWKDRFCWLWNHGPNGSSPGDFVFPLVLHPDTSGMAHVVGTIEAMLLWLKSWGPQVRFVTYEESARDFLKQRA